MAVAIIASTRAAPPPDPRSISQNNGGIVTATVTGIADLAQAYLVFGSQDPGPPTRYEDIAGVLEGQLTALDASFSAQYKPSTGTWTVSLSLSIAAAVVSSGDNLWLAFFAVSGSAPAPTDAPDAVAGPFLAVA